MNYSEALEYLDSFINYERERSVAYPEGFNLDRMVRLAKEFGNPQNSFESILIAGSKGKGSTALILSSILRMENYRVGLYTSPHLTDVRERIRFNGLLISELRFSEIMSRFQKILQEYMWRKEPPTYFELLTVMAFCHFKEMKAQIVVLEVGLGGLYDSTNIAKAKVAGIAPISLEHTEILGKTISKIAVQKCGIIKGREVVVSAPQAREAEVVIEAACQEREAELLRVGREIKITERHHDENLQNFDVRTPFGNYFDLSTHLRGVYQLENIALAITLAKALEKKTRFPVSESAIRQGVLDARWAGRLEKISERPKIVLDGAHNAESAHKALEGLKRHFHYADLVVVLGVSADKDLKGILKVILEEASCLVAVQSANPRARTAQEIAETASEMSDKEIFTEESPEKAMERALALAGPDDILWVVGSLHLVGEIRKKYAEGI